MCGIRWIYSDAGRTNISDSFFKIQNRWPDNHQIQQVWNHTMWFHRLAIMDLSNHGNQPFVIQSGNRYIYWTCNGEIYNYEYLKQKYNLTLSSHSDCEVIWHIYMQIWFENMVQELDWEFAIALIDTYDDKLFLARDPYGVRPLFVWRDDHNIYRSSEAKWIIDICDNTEPFLPWHTISITSNTPKPIKSDYKLYQKYYKPTYKLQNEENQILSNIRDTFINAVRKRLISDRPLWCLLSGWLDSSLVCGVASKILNQPIYTFTIWLEWGTDILYAESVAKYIWSIHQTFVVTIDEALQAIDQVIYTIESRDTTTIRASVWQYLIGKKIRQNTDIKVLLTWEWSDEATWWYMYFHNAPSPEEFDQECKRLLQDIYMYDWLRVDRSMAYHGLEVRIPFLDTEFVQNYLSIDSQLRMPAHYGSEKYLLRKAFDWEQIIPDEVLRRKKEAFSDGVSQNTKSRFEIIQDHIDTIISDEEFANFRNNIYILTWIPEDIIHKCDTKEKYYYYKKFVEYFGTKNLWIVPYYWMPKRSWNTNDPSARVLEIYKK